MTRYRITAHAEGNPDFTTEVDALDEYDARRPCMTRYPHALMGKLVTFTVVELEPAGWHGTAIHPQTGKPVKVWVPRKGAD